MVLEARVAKAQYDAVQWAKLGVAAATAVGILGVIATVIELFTD
jgi:hypothetical protein